MEDQSQTGHDLLSKLQAAYPNIYSSGLLRTVQRRVKVWRGDLARELVFGVSPHATPLMACDALRNVEDRLVPELLMRPWEPSLPRSLFDLLAILDGLSIGLLAGMALTWASKTVIALPVFRKTTLASP